MKSIFQYEHPFVCTDAVVLTLKEQKTDNYRKLPETELRILLYRRTESPYQDCWCLPGGFLNIDEMPEDNIRRKIFEKSHVNRCYLEQLYTFCRVDRDPRARVISLSYLGLMDEDTSDAFKKESVWFTVKNVSGQPFFFQDNDLLLSEEDIGFDHCEIIHMAIERLQSKIQYSNIVFHLLPEAFTLTQLQNVYETILGKKEQAANFRRKIMDMVAETGHSTSDKGHRPAKLYTRRQK